MLKESRFNHGMAWQADLDELNAIAAKAQTAFGLEKAKSRLLQHSENASYFVSPDTGEEFLLRVHGYQNGAAIQSECSLLIFLGKVHDLPVPTPRLSESGEYCVTVADSAKDLSYCCSLIDWRPGNKPMPADICSSQFEKLGQLLAKLHGATASWEPASGFVRPCWDWEGLLGRSFAFELGNGQNWLKKVPAYAPFFERALAKARVLVTSLEPSPDAFGIIHGDLNFDNTLLSGNDLCLMDFDDCGYGYWVYDLASALQPWDSDANFDVYAKSLESGYRSVRQLPKGIEFLREFIAVRHLALLRWAISRSSGVPALKRTIAMRADAAAKAVLACSLSSHDHVSSFIAPQPQWKAC